MILAALAIAFATSCSDDKLLFSLTEVNDLFEPTDQKAIVLKPVPSVFFTWEACDPEKSGTVVYYLVIDRADGDFSNPLYKVLSESNGTRNFALVSHTRLDNIAKMAGAVKGADCLLKWTVLSKKGTEIMKAAKEHRLIVTRMAEYDYIDLPFELYMSGAAADIEAAYSFMNSVESLRIEKRNEEDEDAIVEEYVPEMVGDALKMTKVADGVFEGIASFTKGEPLQFKEAVNGESRTFYLDDGLINEAVAAACDTTGVFKLTVDFNNRSYSYSPAVRVFIYISGPNYECELGYQDLGVWGLTNYRFGSGANSSTDDRYKFRMLTPSGRKTEWRCVYRHNAKPGSNPPVNYYHMWQYPNIDQWAQWPIAPGESATTDQWVWKHPTTLNTTNGNWSTRRHTVTFMLSFTEGEPHRHTFSSTAP